MNPTAADDLLFGDALACEERLPVAFDAAPLDARARQGASDQAEMLLRGLAVAEDARRDDADDAATESRLQRVEAKLDLLIGLLGTLLARSGDTPPAREVAWSWRGLRVDGLHGDGYAPEPGTGGLVRIQAAAWLPQLLALPAEVIAVDAASARTWLRFDPAGGGLGPALERHLFRLHRRAIADARRAGPGAD